MEIDLTKKVTLVMGEADLTLIREALQFYEEKGHFPTVDSAVRLRLRQMMAAIKEGVLK